MQKWRFYQHTAQFLWSAHLTFMESADVVVYLHVFAVIAGSMLKLLLHLLHHQICRWWTDWQAEGQVSHLQQDENEMGDTLHWAAQGGMEEEAHDDKVNN